MNCIKKENQFPRVSELGFPRKTHFIQLSPADLKEQELRRKVGKEVHVYYEDGVHEDATEGGPEDEEPAAVGVGPGAGEESVDHRRDGLQDAVVPLRCGSANVQCKMAKMLNE